MVLVLQCGNIKELRVGELRLLFLKFFLLGFINKLHEKLNLDQEMYLGFDLLKF